MKGPSEGEERDAEFVLAAVGALAGQYAARHGSAATRALLRGIVDNDALWAKMDDAVMLLQAAVADIVDNPNGRGVGP